MKKHCRLVAASAVIKDLNRQNERSVQVLSTTAVSTWIPNPVKTAAAGQNFHHPPIA